MQLWGYHSQPCLLALSLTASNHEFLEAVVWPGPEEAQPFYLFRLIWYSVLCRHNSALSSATRTWRAWQRWAWSWVGLPRSLGSLLPPPTPASSRLWRRSGDLQSSLLLGSGEGSRAHSVCRELQADESLARQAVQLLTEASREDEAADHAVLAMLAVLGKRLGWGTLS
jgi:hypothetical protein